MAISLSITDLIKMFRDQGVSDHDTMARYLDAISEDTSEIATIWAKAYAHGENGVAQEIFATRQRLLYRSLYDLYTHSSAVTAGMDGEQQETLFNALGSFLATRDRIRSAFDALILRDDGWARFMAETSDLINALQDEAGVLRALAIRFRASRG